MALDPFQEQVAAILLAAADGQAFALAGAGALSVHGLIDRPTEDVDLFSPQPGGVGQAMPAVLQALKQHGYQAHVRRAPENHGGDFAQLVVQRGADSVSVDMARDWRQHDAVRLHLGPVLHRDDAAASKMTAALGEAHRATSPTSPHCCSTTHAGYCWRWPTDATPACVRSNLPSLHAA